MEKQLINKQPQNLEFSYETMCNTTILQEEYEICIAIPESKKYIGYITLIQEQSKCSNNGPNLNPFYPVLIIYDLNRYRKINNIYNIATVNHSFCEVASWMKDTIFYGSIINNFFIIEDILYYNNISLRNAVFKDKLNIIIRILSLNDYFDFLPQSFNSSSHQSYEPLKFVLPFIFKNNGQTTISNVSNEIPYPIHHIQYRSISILKPILNVTITRNDCLNLNTKYSCITKKTPISNIQSSPNLTNSYLDKHGSVFKFNYNKPQYKKKTILEVIADIQNDIYMLYAYNNILISNNKHIFIDVALIPDYKTSTYMNSIFRKIKENINIDYIEESDDEEEFENADDNKYVNLTKKVNMECYFNYKFKKWVPIKFIENNVNFGKIVPISNL